MSLSQRSKTKRPADPGQELQRYKERLESMLELSSDWYWEQDENCRFTLVVGRGFEQTGIESQEYLGTCRWDHGAVPVDDGGSWDKHKALLEARQPFADFVFKRLNARGELRYLSSHRATGIRREKSGSRATAERPGTSPPACARNSCCGWSMR